MVTSGLVRDSTIVEHKPAVSTAFRATQPKHLTWGPFRVLLLIVALVFLATHGNFSFQGSGSENQVSSIAGLNNVVPRGGTIGRVVVPGVAYAIIVSCILLQGRLVVRLAMSLKLLTALALLTIVSAGWSQEPSRSLVFGGLYFIDTLFAYALIVIFAMKDLRRLLLYSGIAIGLLSLFISIALPQYGVVHQIRDFGSWNGLFSDRTSAAKCLTFLFSAAVSFWRRPTKVELFGGFLLLFLLLMAHAVTSIVVLTIWTLLMGVLALRQRLERRSASFLSGAFLIAIVAVAFLLVFVLPVVLEALGRDITLSGRTQVWKLVLLSIAKRPLLGYGFYAFWLGMRGESANIIIAMQWVFGYAHNGILEIALQMGLVGVGIFFLTLFQAMRNAWRCIQAGTFDEVQWFISLLILSCLYNIDEATVVWPNELLSVLYIVACAGLAIHAREISNGPTIGRVEVKKL